MGNKDFMAIHSNTDILGKTTNVNLVVALEGNTLSLINHKTHIKSNKIKP